jgi:adenylate cyclase
VWIDTYAAEDAADRAGVDVAYLAHLVEIGILAPREADQYSATDIRRVLMIKSLQDAGIALDGLASATARGALNLDFLETAAYERFVGLASETFRQVSDRTGIPLDLLKVVREAIGLAEPSADDRLREDEKAIVAFVALQVAEGFQPISIERLLRVHGDSTRRMAEQEGAWWNAEVIAPAMAAGGTLDEMANADLAERTSPLAEESMLAMYHAQQARVWTANIIDGFERLLAQAGLHSRLERPPAICFLDITGYTRLTQERGDDAAAELASSVARLVERSSVRHGGKPIKWLGDGVMFYFPDCGPSVRSALEMVGGLASAGLPPAHVGLHAGPVLFQAGDYFGQTVNISARIADYARPGEVLVSRLVADGTHETGIAFEAIGPVELKGVSGAMELLRAHLA